MQDRWRYIDNRIVYFVDRAESNVYDYGLLLDVFISSVYFIIAYFAIKHLSKVRIKNDKLRSTFIYGWFFRVAGALFIYFFYLLYYGSGDTINYLRDANVMATMLYEMPAHSLYYFYMSVTQKNFLDTLLELNDVYYYAKYKNSYFLNYIIDYNSEMVALFTMPFTILGAGVRYATLIIVATVSFLASWMIYITFLRQYPRYARMLSLPLLYLPSLNVWTGSPFKETYALIGISILIYGAYEFLYLRRWFCLPIMAFGLWLAYTVKPYVALSILPWIVIWVYLTLNKRMAHPLYKYFFSPVLFLFFIGTSYYGVLSLAEGTPKYSLDNIPKQAYLVYTDLKQNYTYYQETGGSVYDIGDFEPTVSGMLSKFPIATFTAMFRPFIWEANKPVILLAALETIVVLMIVIVNIFRYGVIGIIRKIVSDPFLIFCFGYSIFFLFMIGLTSGNFGNLVRYRVPGYIFFLGGLFVAFGKLRDEANRHRSWQQWSRSRFGGGSARLAG
jgi:hypothetical protein